MSASTRALILFINYGIGTKIRNYMEGTLLNYKSFI